MAAGVLLRFSTQKEPDTALVVVLVVAIVFAALSGLFQLGELAQLPRELTQATLLLKRLSDLKTAGVDFGRPTPPIDGASWLS